MFPQVLETNPQQKIYIGTCAWTYDDWRGVFYPPRLPQNQWLQFYAKYFRSVEIDSTFYHAPGAKAIAHWVGQTPDDFRFTCKMPKKITHELRLRDCEEPVAAFLESLEPMRPKLGCILLQMPPGFSPQRDEKALKTFLAALPPHFRFAVEFRHPDWHVPRIVHYLEDHGICWAWNDLTKVHEQNRGAFEPLPQTTNIVYVRLMGDIAHKYNPDGSRIHRYGKLMWPRDSSLENWAIKIQKHLDHCDRVFLNISNHFEGAAHLTAQRISRLLNAPIDLPAIPEEAPASEKQMTLL